MGFQRVSDDVRSIASHVVVVVSWWEQLQVGRRCDDVNAKTGYRYSRERFI